ncbi:MAG TPA: hypothetical protein DDX40_08500 [Rikenellaceae bacterium]|nr:hypothetical protein [Rikenellaceae bacterium]
MKRYLTVIILALSSGLFADIGAQERGSAAYRTSTWSLYAEGGATMVHGLGMSSVDAAPGMNIFPEIGAGVSFNIRPWIRLGLNYDFSKYAREQRFSEFQPLEAPVGEGTLSERYGGLAYSKMWTHYHAADLTLEFNIMELWRNRQDRRFNLYAGAGFGWIFAKGNTYDISMGHERWSEPYKETINTWLDAVNTRHNYNIGYVPMLLSAEFDVSPVVTIGLQGNYKRLLGSDNAPKGIGTASVVLRLNILGSKSGYKSAGRKLRESELALAAMTVAGATAKADCEASGKAKDEALASARSENASLRSQVDSLEKENAGLKARRANEVLQKLTVHFSNDSFKLLPEAKASLDSFAESLKGMKETELVVVGEASATGTSGHNLRLSELRIETVLDYLRKQGVDCSRALRQPLGDSGKDASDSARRATILVVSGVSK